MDGFRACTAAASAATFAQPREREGFINARIVIGLVTLTAVLAVGADARGEPRTYTIDPLRSQLQFSGRIAGIDAEPQTPGSDTTRYTGSLMVDVTGSTIQFLEGSVIDAQVQPLAQEPGNSGNAGAAAADYGFYADQLFQGENQVALRDFIFDISGTSAPGGQDLVVDSGNLDYLFGQLGDRESQRGERATNTAAAPTLTTVGNIETLTIPVNAPFFFYTFANSDTPLTATGQIVATRVIPEPGTAGVLAAAAGVAGLLRRRRPYPV